MSGKTEGAEHFGLGNVASMVGLNKRSLMEFIKLGAGAAGAVTVTDLALSRLLVKDGRPIIPIAWSPAAIAVMSIIGGGIIKRKVDDDVGTGAIAGGVGLALAELIKRFTAPAMSAAAAATTTAAETAELQGYGAQTLAGFGAGRAFAPGLGGFSGLGRVHCGSSAPALFGVGTPDMSANRMFNGATVAMEDSDGPMAGATVQYEDSEAFAGTFN